MPDADTTELETQMVFKEEGRAIQCMLKEVDGVSLPAIGLGTWQLRGEECRAAVEQALDMGYRHVDTAQMYANERPVGQGIVDANVDREDVFLTTKLWHTDLDRGSVQREVHGSLEQLQTDYLDLLLIHWPNPDVPLEETLDAMQQLMNDGLVRHIGVSNFTVDLLEQALDITPNLFCNQVEMHPFYQQQEMQQFCVDHDLFLVAYSPLAQGRVLKHELLQEISDQYDRTPAQVALRWLIQQDNVAAIPRASDEQYQRANLAAQEFELSDEDMQRISSIPQERKLVNPQFAPW